MTEQHLLRLWGKTNRDEKKRNANAPDKYHPLLFHLLDVALCARVLWDKGLSAKTHKRLADLFNLSEANMRSLIVLLAGLHDLGKAYPYFQNQSQKFADILRSSPWEFDLTPCPCNAPHGTVSVPEIERLFCSSQYVLHDANKSLACTLAILSGGHHGVFARASDLEKVTPATVKLGGENWDAIRDRLANLVAQLLSTPSISLAACPNPDDLRAPDIVPLIAGLIAIADWFGSSKYFGAHYFPNRPTSIAAYLPKAIQQAEKAVSASGWLRPVRLEPLDDRPMTELFAYLAKGGTFTPNAVQRKTLELIAGRAQPYLLLVETAMGSGKTEAALACISHAQCHGFADGFYIALPTMATSNSMYIRASDYLNARYPGKTPNLLLAHSHAFLDPDYQKRIEAGDIQETEIETAIYDDTGSQNDMDEKGVAGRVVARRWFAENKKQALLAQFGVGTIDQTLLGVLQTKHWFVRLFGLAGKVVCFDEIHSYDIYMSSLLYRLIQWLGEMGCTVVLLSATLSANQRGKLLQAWGVKTLPTPEKAYPRLTIAGRDSDTARQETVETKESPKTVTLDFAPNDWKSVHERLLAALPKGGCAAVVCNTVTRAQALFRELEPILSAAGWECVLFHARTPFQWRKDREDAIVWKFGKQNDIKDCPKSLLDAETGEPRNRPCKSIVISTQILEQSLDLDFDFIFSEVAPVDLILQRMGRMHRHNTEKYPRPGRPTEARFCILADMSSESAIPDFGRSVKRNPEQSIYDRYIILRSWLALHRLPPEVPVTLSLPDDIEDLVRTVYDDDPPAALPPDWQEALDDSKQRSEEKRDADEDKAKKVIVSKPTDFLEFWQDKKFDTLNDEDDPAVHERMRAATRLGPPSITVVCFGTLAPGDTELPLLPQKVDLPEDRAQARQLEREWMRFSLSIQYKGLYHALVDQKQEPGWKESTLLKYARDIDFTNGQATIGDISVRLSSKYGLEIIQ